MELIDLRRILSTKAKRMIDDEVKRYAAGQKWKVHLGQANFGIGNGFNDDSYEMLNNIIDVVCKHYKTERAVILAKSRIKPYVGYRQVVHFLARKYTKLHLADIGAMVGGVDHATVIHSIKEVKSLMSDMAFANHVDIIEHKILLTTEI